MGSGADPPIQAPFLQRPDPSGDRGWGEKMEKGEKGPWTSFIKGRWEEGCWNTLDPNIPKLYRKWGLPNRREHPRFFVVFFGEMSFIDCLR